MRIDLNFLFGSFEINKWYTPLRKLHSVYHIFWFISSWTEKKLWSFVNWQNTPAFHFYKWVCTTVPVPSHVEPKIKICIGWFS